MRVTLESKEVKLPDFIVVGAAKSGTTSLYFYLKEHPQIFLPEIKELCFFCFMGSDRSPWGVPLPVKSLEEYIESFRNAKEDQIIGEFETYYLYYYSQTIANIKKVYGDKAQDLKIVVLLRHPIERVISQYHYAVQHLEEDLPFHIATKRETIQGRKKKSMPSPLDYIGYSLYYEQVKAYIDNFQHVKVFFYDDFRENPLKFLEELYSFLEVDFYKPQSLNRRFNVTFVPKNRVSKAILKFILSAKLNVLLKRVAGNRYEKLKKQFYYNFLMKRPNLKETVDCESVEYLREIFKEDILKLQDLLGIDLSHWLNRKIDCKEVNR